MSLCFLSLFISTKLESEVLRENRDTRGNAWQELGAYVNFALTAIEDLRGLNYNVYHCCFNID